MSNTRDVRSGVGSAADRGATAISPMVVPGKRTLTESLPVIEAKPEPKGSGTAKVDGGGAPEGDAGVAKGPLATSRPTAGKAGETAEVTNTPAPVPMDAGTGAVAAKHVKPTFVLNQKEGARSNSAPATTTTDNPTCTGKVVKDGAVWRYQIDSVESKGTIDLVYYTADHYPAPTPNDDSGALSNVTKANHTDIIKDLKDHRTIVAGNWSSYRRTQLHEHYHWETEWQGEVKKELVKAEDEIAKLSSSAATEADATSELAPKAKKIFDDHMKAARNSYNALPDTPGSAPYVAGAAGVDALIARIQAHATSNGW